MLTGKWSFNPGLVPTLATLLVFPLLLVLGFWQLDRADQKQALFDDYMKSASHAPADINAITSQRDTHESILWRRGTLSGVYAGTRLLLLDNQVWSGTAGYHVYQPFQASGSERWILVNRGWVPAGSYRNIVPDIAATEGAYKLTGMITAFPSSPGIIADEQALIPETLLPGIDRVSVISQQAAEQILGHPVFPYVFRLDGDSPSGLVREWPQPGSGKERHLGYAFQWFSLAGVLLVIYLSLNLRRRKPVC